MRRRLFNILATMSVVLYIVTAAMWVRSYFASYRFVVALKLSPTASLPRMLVTQRSYQLQRRRENVMRAISRHLLLPRRFAYVANLVVRGVSWNPRLNATEVES